MADIKIKDVPLVSTITGQEKIPVSNGSGKPVAITVQQILDITSQNSEIEEMENKISALENKVNSVYTKEEINSLIITTLNTEV